MFSPESENAYANRHSVPSTKKGEQCIAQGIYKTLKDASALETGPLRTLRGELITLFVRSKTDSEGNIKADREYDNIPHIIAIDAQLQVVTFLLECRDESRNPDDNTVCDKLGCELATLMEYGTIAEEEDARLKQGLPDNMEE